MPTEFNIILLSSVTTSFKLVAKAFSFSFNSSLLSVDGRTCLIPFQSLRNDLSNGTSHVEIVSIFRL